MSQYPYNPEVNTSGRKQSKQQQNTWQAEAKVVLTGRCEYYVSDEKYSGATDTFGHNMFSATRSYVLCLTIATPTGLCRPVDPSIVSPVVVFVHGTYNNIHPSIVSSAIEDG